MCKSLLAGMRVGVLFLLEFSFTQGGSYLHSVAAAAAAWRDFPLSPLPTTATNWELGDFFSWRILQSTDLVIRDTSCCQRADNAFSNGQNIYKRKCKPGQFNEAQVEEYNLERPHCTKTENAVRMLSATLLLLLLLNNWNWRELALPNFLFLGYGSIFTLVTENKI